jgi:L-fuconolactonase
MMKIDAHQHFWRYQPTVHTWMDGRMSAIKRDFLPPDLEPLLGAQGYAGCVAVQASQTLQETEWLLQLADQHAIIRGVVGWVDLRSPAIQDQLARFSVHPRLRMLGRTSQPQRARRHSGRDLSPDLSTAVHPHWTIIASHP